MKTEKINGITEVILNDAIKEIYYYHTRNSEIQIMNEKYNTYFKLFPEVNEEIKVQTSKAMYIVTEVIFNSCVMEYWGWNKANYCTLVFASGTELSIKKKIIEKIFCSIK